MMLCTFVLQLENSNMSIFQVFQKHVFALCDGTNQKYILCVYTYLNYKSPNTIGIMMSKKKGYMQHKLNLKVRPTTEVKIFNK